MTPVAPDLPAPGTVGRRRLGLLLATFGAVGLLLVGTAFAFVARPVDAEVGPFGIEGQRRQLVDLLDTSSRSIESAETAARDADRSLGSTSTAAASAASLMNELSTTMRALAVSLRVSFLGSQPFAPVADDMDRVADRAATTAADLDLAASSVRVAADDMAVLAADLGAMRAEVVRIRASLSDPIETGVWRLLLAAMLAWLAIPAAVSLWLGLRWLGPGGRHPVPVPARSAGATSPRATQPPD